MCSAGESPVVSIVTGSVLQTEAGLVALSHRLVGAGIQQLVVAELIHAVKVPVEQQQQGSATFLIKRGSSTSILDLAITVKQPGRLRHAAFTHVLSDISRGSLKWLQVTVTKSLEVFTYHVHEELQRI